MPKLLFTTSSFNLDNFYERESIESSGYELILNPYGKRLTEPQVAELMDDEVVGMVAGVEPLTKDVLKNAPNLKVISRCGIGIDNVDLDYAKSVGISIFNTPDAPSKAVAELALSHMLSLSRRITESDRMIRGGEWKPLMGKLIAQQTIGVIGYGRIGKLVIDLLKSFGAKILVYEKEIIKNDNDIECVPFDYLLKNSDIITLHVPYTAETDNIIDKNALALCKKDALLINTARGGLVDEDALYESLKSNNIGGVAMDCFSVEPYQGKLLEFNNVQVTAHMGSYANESRMMMEAEACSELVKGMNKHGLL